MMWYEYWLGVIELFKCYYPDRSSFFIFLRKFSGYDILDPPDVELGEIIPKDSLVHGVNGYQYVNSTRKVSLKLRSPHIIFFDDSLHLPDGQRIKYEYIANYSIRDGHILVLRTFTDYYNEFGIIKADNISNIILSFDNTRSVVDFRNLFFKKILVYKNKNCFDKSIFKMSSFRKIISSLTSV